MQELAGLLGMPGTVQGVRKWAKKNLPVSRTKEHGKGLEYALKSLPAETQAHLRAQAFAAVFTTLRHEARALQPGHGVPQARDVLPMAAIDLMVQEVLSQGPARTEPPARPAKADKTPATQQPKPAKPTKKPGTALVVRQSGGVQADGACIKSGQVRRAKTDLTDRDRAYQDAALLLMRALDDAMQQQGCSARKGAQALAAHIMNKTAAPELQGAAVTVYIKPRGVTHLGGLDALTARLQKMHGFYQEGCKVANPAAFLIAGRPEKRAVDPVALQAFLLHYCHPNRPTVMQAWKNASAWYAGQGVSRPAVDSWYRLEKELPLTVKNRARMTGSAFKALKPYISRDVSMFKSNDIWVGDGHTFKARVQSPIHGNAFRPEVTFIMDWRSRKIVGWSVALAENVIAVSDAFRHAQMLTRARPLIYYSDNGAGQTGKHIDHPMHGTLGRQGIAHETGIPGNPQGRGVIERIWATTLIPLAQQYATYVGKKGDAETIRKVGVALLSAQRKGETLPLLPSWAQFQADLQFCVDDYNQNHSHSGIDGLTPNEAYAQFMDPNSVVFGVSDAEINAMWMPEVARVPARGVIQLFSNEYFCPEIAELERGTSVRVRFDIHNANTVRVLEQKTGAFLGVAIWDKHRRAAFPVPFVEDIRQKRAMGIKRRAQSEIDRADDELMVTYDAQGAQVLPFVNSLASQGEALNVPAQPVVPAAVQPLELTESGQETPEEQRLRQFMEAARQAQPEEDTDDENGWPSERPDRLFLAIRAEQDEIYRQEQEQEELRRREAL